MMPFTYPQYPHIRRHGPSGYKDYGRYRPWLRDEFLFRCVYCLKREQWGNFRSQYSLDHFLPQARFPNLALDYENLLYSCATCNTAKSDEVVPNPCECMLRGKVIVHEDGAIKGTSIDSKKLIRKLGLDDSEYCEYRRLYIDIIALARTADPNLYKLLMKFPDELPNLSILRPPGNSLPQGIQQSYYSRRARGDLPDIY